MEADIRHLFHLLPQDDSLDTQTVFDASSLSLRSNALLFVRQEDERNKQKEESELNERDE